jgi:hypothetical protein
VHEVPFFGAAVGKLISRRILQANADYVWIVVFVFVRQDAGGRDFLGESQ